MPDRGMVVTPQPEASEAGRGVPGAGGCAARISTVMAGLVPAIHVFPSGYRSKAWMAGTSVRP
jgi:hypothetical protein